MADIPGFENKIIEVCDKCDRASCWYGEFMCDDARTAGTEKKTVAKLRKLGLENEDYWGDEMMWNVYGSSAPFGYQVNGIALTQYEDELPEMTKDEYSEWFRKSVLVDGVRMGPPVKAERMG